MNATQARSERLLALSLAVYRALLLLYPARFRHAYAAEMAQVFRASCRQASREGGALALARLWRVTLGDLIVTALAERWEQDMTKTSTALYRTTGLVSLVGIAVWILGPLALVAATALAYRTGSTTTPGAAPPLMVMMALPAGWLFFVVGFIGLYTLLAERCGAIIWLPGVAAIATLIALVVASMYWTYSSQLGAQQMGSVTVVNLSAASAVNQQWDDYAYALSNLAYPALGLALVVTGLMALRTSALRAVARTLLVMGVVGMLYYFVTDMGAPSLLRNTGTPGLLGMMAGSLTFFGVWLVGWLRLGRWLWRAGALPAP
ncbi:MAG TPA: hypothetical protein VIC27_08225, partial [Ktedonobacterales bacterium]